MYLSYQKKKKINLIFTKKKENKFNLNKLFLITPANSKVCARV